MYKNKLRIDSYLFHYYFWFFSHFYFWTTGIWYLTIQLWKRVTLTPYWFQEWKTIGCGKLNLRHSSYACNSKALWRSLGRRASLWWLVNQNRSYPIRYPCPIPPNHKADQNIRGLMTQWACCHSLTPSLSITLV